MSPASARTLEPLGAAILAASAVAVALISQHRYDLQPCPWCVLQRLVFGLGAAVALLEAACVGLQALPPSGMALRAMAGLRLALAASGVGAALWQHFVASATASCNLTLADRLMAFTGLDGWLPDIFQARASCLDAKAQLLGLPYEGWSAALFLLLAVLAGRSVWRGPGALPLRHPSTLAA